jgi:hypothetical protein
VYEQVLGDGQIMREDFSAVFEKEKEKEKEKCANG